MSIAPDGTITEERIPTPIGNTACLPSGTMTTAPSATPTGPTPLTPTGAPAPVVAANTVSKWADPAFLSAAGGALLALADPVVGALLKTGPVHWRSLVAACILALVAFFRQRYNTVTR